MGVALANTIAAETQYTGALVASLVLFKRLLVTVVRETMRWHHKVIQLLDLSNTRLVLVSFDQSRMLNRFSKDDETADISLAGTAISKLVHGCLFCVSFDCHVSLQKALYIVGD